MSKQLGPIGQHAKQCQHCYKPESLPDFKLLTCSSCHRAHYCNKECQKDDWPKHKAICKLNREAKARMKEKDIAQEGQSPEASMGLDATTVEKYLKPFLQIHRPILQVTFIHALNLTTQPANIDTHVLTVTLTPTFTTKPPPSADPAKLFTLASTIVATYEDTLAAIENGPRTEYAAPLRAQMVSIRAQSAALKQRGGMGIGLTFVACERIVHAVPFGVPDSDLSAVPVQKDWEASLAFALEKGMRF